MSLAFSKPGMCSPYFTGTIGETILPSAVPASNYLIDDARYDYEGNWAFCRFDDGEIFGARFGFGRGRVGLQDYGSADEQPASFLMLHLEVMTRDGAWLWIGSQKYRAEEITLDPAHMAHTLAPGGNEILRIEGWPDMRWRMQSDDGALAVDMAVDVRNVTILPDCVMQHNLFAMWLAIARAAGEIRIGDRTRRVTGTAFYDHPRINVVEHDVPRFGWYLYTPTRFDDGSHLAAYYTIDSSGNRVDYYSCGLYVDAAGTATWLPEVTLQHFEIDDDRKPCAWTLQYAGDGLTFDVDARVRETAICRAWGTDAVAQSRRENTNMPLIYEVTADMRRDGDSAKLTGGGLAEYLSYLAD